MHGTFVEKWWKENIIRGAYFLAIKTKCRRKRDQMRLTQSGHRPKPWLITGFITYGAKLLNADWLRRRAFFLNHEGTFGKQEGMIS